MRRPAPPRPKPVHARCVANPLFTARGTAVPPCEGRLGRIAAGFEANFTVFDRDAFTTLVGDTDKTSVSEIWDSGEQIFARQR